MVQKVYKPGSPKTFSPRVAFIDIPIQCMDRDDDTACRDPASDEDDDGCTATEEAAPGSNFSDNEWCDDDSLKGIMPPHDGYLENNLMYDRSPGLPPDGGVDPAGPPNGVIDIGDVLGTLAQSFEVSCSA